MARSGVIYGSTEEMWRPVPGHDGQFIASSHGRIARTVGHLGANGYVQISMRRSMKPFSDVLGVSIATVGNRLRAADLGRAN